MWVRGEAGCANGVVRVEGCVIDWLDIGFLWGWEGGGEGMVEIDGWTIFKLLPMEESRFSTVESRFELDCIHLVPLRP